MYNIGTQFKLKEEIQIGKEKFSESTIVEIDSYVNDNSIQYNLLFKDKEKNKNVIHFAFPEEFIEKNLIILNK